MPAAFDELSAFVAIPSVSADPAHAGDVLAAGEWVCSFLRGAGGSAELVDWHGQPLAVGELPASRDPARAPTVLCYGHFDVQPPGPLELWDSPPFELQERDGYLYGRGAADDKGPLYLLLTGARDLAQAGVLPVNLRFVCDGEEETGGNSIVEFLQADERAADVAVVFDTVMIERDRPAFNVATRGIVYLQVRLRTGVRDLHSGLYGGAALNAAHALMRTLAAVVSEEGRLREELRAGVEPPTEDELRSWAELPPGAGELAGQGARPADASAAEEFYLRTFAEPSLDVNGIESGQAQLVKTIVPTEAVANVSIRLVAGQRPEQVASACRQLLLDAAPDGAELEISLRAAAAPSLVSPEARPIQLGLDAFEEALGVRPILVRSGGTLPIAAALAAREIPAILTGFALPDANIHAPNERLLAEYLPRGAQAARSLFEHLGRL